MKLTEFHYDLPPEQIAQEPVTPRDQARLLVLEAGRDPSHRRFYELDQILRPGDVLVTNATKVFPARLRGRKTKGGKVELLLLGPMEGERRWRALVRGALRPVAIEFPEGLRADMGEALPNGEWAIDFSSNHVRDYLDRHGEMPLPPYIKRAEKRPADLDRYQTVFAKAEGAVAAPTAGFHFTPELLGRLQERGVERREITLHVGWGTFRPVRTESIEDHRMLPERFDVSEETAAALNEARREGRRIVAVGTTVVRTLETAVDAASIVRGGRGEAGLFIYPGYHFKAVDALITNFHLPDSTPLLLANAFALDLLKGKRDGGGPFALRSAYEEAIRTGYRFYSYGDAMLIQ